MKTILIVYAASWLILLFVYIISLFQNKKSKKKDGAFEKFLNKHKSTKEKILDKLVYVIMIVFAPLVVFVIPYILIRNMKTKKQTRIREEERERSIPYILIRNMKTKKQTRIREEERERSEREEKEHIAVCATNYSVLVSEKQNQCGDDYIRIAKSLKKLVDKKSYQEIINLLDKTSLPAAMKLGVRECEHKGAGSGSRLVIETAKNVSEDNIFNYLKFEDSPMGAWQAYLLCQMWHYLPLWWHANYDKRDYIYSREDYLNITHFIDRGFNVDVLKDFNVNPEIYGNDGKYYISCCFWTDFGGLNEGLFVFEEKVIYEYQCGIMF